MVVSPRRGEQGGEEIHLGTRIIVVPVPMLCELGKDVHLHEQGTSCKDGTLQGWACNRC